MKLILEYLPIIAFFLAFKLSGILTATKVIVIATILVNLFSLLILKSRPSNTSLLSNGLIIIFGLLTVFTENTIFIKMKPTLINLLFSLILFFGIKYNKYPLKNIMGPILKMSEQKWINLSKKFAFFFLFVALLNEIIWRNFSEEFWVNFKVFFFPIIFLCFSIMQIYLHKIYIIKEAGVK